MKRNRKVVLALGSNVGNRRENLVRAVSEIEKFSRVNFRSMIYETFPVGFESQRDFLNAAISIDTEFAPDELLSFCKAAENSVGRIKTFINGPRVIDIDIIFYENESMDTHLLRIPHPRWQERDFVVSPLIDLLDAGVFDSPEFKEFKNIISTRSRAFLPFSSF